MSLTSPTSSPHRSQRWDVTAAREVLTEAGENDWDTSRDAGDGFFASVSPQHGRIQISMVRGGVPLNYPRTRDDIFRWKMTLQRWAKILLDSGKWKNIQVGRGTVTATTVTAGQSVTVAVVSPIGDGHYSIAFDGRPEIGGSVTFIDAKVSGGCSTYLKDHNGYVVASEYDAEGTRDVDPAAEILAKWLGLPEPVLVQKIMKDAA